MDKIAGDLTGVELDPTRGPTRHPILFIHGWWGGAWIWADRFMPFFASPGYRCLAVNLRGNHGSGAVPDPGRISFDDHVQDVHAHYIMREPGWRQVARDVADWLEDKVPARA